MNPQIGVGGGVNVDSAGKRKQVIEVEKLGERLVNPTFFEVEGWKRMKFFPNALQKFGFDPDSAKLRLEEVELPISIGNDQIYNAIGWNYQSHTKTFLVREMNLFFALSNFMQDVSILSFRTPLMMVTLLSPFYQIFAITMLTLFSSIRWITRNSTSRTLME